MLYIRFYPQILSIMSEINKWNEKLNNFAEKHMDNVWVGTLILMVVFAICAWAINLLSK